MLFIKSGMLFHKRLLNFMLFTTSFSDTFHPALISALIRASHNDLEIKQNLQTDAKMPFAKFHMD